MKQKENKKVQYVLVVLVLLIWGIVGYRFFNWNQDSFSPDFTTPTILPTQASDAVKVKDTFALQANYRDPFLDKQVRSKKKRTSSSHSTKSSRYERKAPPPVPGLTKKETPAPSVIYRGYSVNNNKVTRVRVNIKGSNLTMQVHDFAEGLTLREMYRDSVVFDWKGKRHVVLREK